MYNITYLSKEDRERHDAIREWLPYADSKERPELLEELAKIESRRKPLKECGIEECTELRTFIYEKFDRLNRAGKYGVALPFKQMLLAIDQRVHMLHMQMTKEAIEKQKAEKEGKLKERLKGSKHEESGDRPKASKGRSRWTVNLGGLD